MDNSDKEKGGLLLALKIGAFEIIVIILLVAVIIFVLNYLNIISLSDLFSRPSSSAPTQQQETFRNAPTPDQTLLSYLRQTLKSEFVTDDLKVFKATPKTPLGYEIYIASVSTPDKFINANYYVGTGGKFRQEVPIEIVVSVYESSRSAEQLAPQNLSQVMGDYFNTNFSLGASSWKEFTATQGGRVIEAVSPVVDLQDRSKETRTLWFKKPTKANLPEGKVPGASYEIRACKVFSASPGYNTGTCTEEF